MKVAWPYFAKFCHLCVMFYFQMIFNKKKNMFIPIQCDLLLFHDHCNNLKLDQRLHLYFRMEGDFTMVMVIMIAMVIMVIMLQSSRS